MLHRCHVRSMQTGTYDHSRGPQVAKQDQDGHVVVVELVGPLVCQGVQRRPGLHLLDAGQHLVTVPPPVVLEVKVVVANDALQRGSASVVCVWGCVCVRLGGMTG